MSEMLECAPRKRLSFLKLHLNPYQHNFSIIDRLNLKTVVLIRDMRDMLISRYYHIMTSNNHWDYRRLLGFQEEERLYESMRGVVPVDSSETVIQYYSKWINGWLERAEENHHKTIVVTFEELKEDTFSALKKVYMFFGYTTENHIIKRVIERQTIHFQNSLKNDLSTNLKQKGRSMSTFRKGKTGEWRECFDEKTKNYFKSFAGGTLIKAGYEDGLDW